MSVHIQKRTTGLTARFKIVPDSDYLQITPIRCFKKETGSPETYEFPEFAQFLEPREVRAARAALESSESVESYPLLIQRASSMLGDLSDEAIPSSSSRFSIISYRSLENLRWLCVGLGGSLSVLLQSLTWIGLFFALAIVVYFGELVHQLSAKHPSRLARAFYLIAAGILLAEFFVLLISVYAKYLSRQ